MKASQNRWIFIILLISVIGFGQKKQAQKGIDETRMLKLFESLSGVTYKVAGITPDGFDCSGFVYYVFIQFGIDTGHSSITLSGLGREISMNDAKFGDIQIFTGTDSSNRSPGHAGIICSQPGELLTFIHSSSAKKNYGVTKTVYLKSNYPERFLQIRRIATVK